MNDLKWYSIQMIDGVSCERPATNLVELFKEVNKLMRNMCYHEDEIIAIDYLGDDWQATPMKETTMKIKTKNEFAALLAGIELGKTLDLSFHGTHDGRAEVSDGGCEGWLLMFSPRDGFIVQSAEDVYDSEILKALNKGMSDAIVCWEQLEKE